MCSPVQVVSFGTLISNRQYQQNLIYTIKRVITKNYVKQSKGFF